MSLSLPRCIGLRSEKKTVEVNIFTDASSSAYGAPAYIKVESGNTRSCNLVIGKSKLTSVKNKLTTMPRLEIETALLASQIKVTIFHQMDINIKSAFLMSDSKPVSNYLCSKEKNFGPYIMCRCNELDL